MPVKKPTNKYKTHKASDKSVTAYRVGGKYDVGSAKGELIRGSSAFASAATIKKRPSGRSVAETASAMRDATAEDKLKFRSRKKK